MKKFFFLLAAFSLTGFAALAQGNVNVHQDSRLSMLVQKQIYINSVAARHVPGFRVQVIYTVNRSKALEVKSRLMELFPGYPAYISFEAPYFRVRIGDFRTRDDAGGLEKEVSKYFSDGVFIARDIINVTADNNDPENDTGN